MSSLAQLGPQLQKFLQAVLCQKRGPFFIPAARKLQSKHLALLFTSASCTSSLYFVEIRRGQVVQCVDL